MIIDINAHLGPYAFRQLRDYTAPELLNLMDRHNFAHAVVCSNPALLYRDTHRGNEEMAQEIHDSRRFSGGDKWGDGPRLTGIATVNPLFSGWRHDLEVALDQWNFKGVRLLPNYHGYALDDEIAAEALQICVQRGIPLVLHQRIEDRRQKHAWDNADDLSFEAVATVAKSYPDLKFLLLNWLGLNGEAIKAAGLQGRVLIDFNRFDVTLYDHLPKLIEAIGFEAVAFGTHAPFNYVGPALVRLEVLPASDSEREAVAWRNAARFLNLNVTEPREEN